MDYVIEISLPKTAFVVGNRILSRLFLLRYLTYQPRPFSFSETYRVLIIDNDVDELEIGWGQAVDIVGGGSGDGGGAEQETEDQELQDHEDHEDHEDHQDHDDAVSAKGYQICYC